MPTILVVDDEPALRSFAEMLLLELDYQPILAENGRAAVKILLSEPSAVDAVLLDMTMPGLSPEETFRMMREIRLDLPIIVLSGELEESVRARFGKSTISGYIEKPYSEKDLDVVLTRALTRPKVATEKSFELKTISTEELAEARRTYVKNCRTKMAAVSDLAAHGEFGSMRALAHTLKGGGGCFGLPEITEWGKQLERGIDAADRDACGRIWNQLDCHLQQLETTV